MSAVVNVAIHSSQFPEAVRLDLLNSLRTRRVNHKFHYDSVKQTQKWLALHQEYSPSRNDADCTAIYDRSFETVSQRAAARRIHLVGLGCGGGQKDTRLLSRLHGRGMEVFYTPSDVSTAMVLVANQAASTVVPAGNLFPFVCDLASAKDLPAWFDRQSPAESRRLVTFFGMIPNFEPSDILTKLVSLIRPEDVLLFSANLASEAEYQAGLPGILPQYDNPLTREWLVTFLYDLGVSPDDGQLRFHVETNPPGSGLKRIAADFIFARARTLQVDGEPFEFRTGEAIRLFFSCRYTPDQICSLLQQHGLLVQDQWITGTQQEGVFLCRRQ